MLFSWLPIVPPALFFLVAIACALRPGRRPGFVLQAAEIAAIGAIIAAVFSAIGLASVSAWTVPMIADEAAFLAMRVDVVSVIMALLVSFVGWVVLRYARVYLDGEDRQGAFTAWLSATLGAVLMLVLAGHLVQLFLAWVATSLFLNRLLLFYPDRVQAQRAARKKRVVARTGDVVLLTGCLLLGQVYGTGDIARIAALASEGGSSIALYGAAACLAVAALLKSAQFPSHGWLTEVMETPTPVSALLHAGLINAGGFLLIRFADVLLNAPIVLAFLVLVGGFTALFGGLVMLTQPAVKTSLAWSTVAQMGFMILQCGLALFPLALLHIVAHSLYKAHAFLASGNAVEMVAAIKRPGPVATPGVAAVARAFLAALLLYGVMAVAIGLEHQPPQAIALGAILIFGVAYLLAQGLADKAPDFLTRRTALYAAAASLAYFALHRGVEILTAGTLPVPPVPGALEWALLALAVVSFGTVALMQSMFPLWANHPAAAGLRVHLSNGLYLNALFDRMLGGWSVRRSHF